MTALAPVDAPVPPTVEPAPRPPRRALLRRPAVMGLLLLLAYVGLSFANDTRAVFVSDVGGKVATLRSMDARGDLDPDVGYWAADLDPEGALHPLDNTVQVGGRWVNVTTLPMLYAARPLYALGGTRAALLLPMLGAVLVAFGARALARRLGDDGDGAFWLVGLATPVVLYGLDLWEHAPGLACMVWAVVLGLDVVRGDRGAFAALGAGALFGAAATMRTEALVYLVVAGGVLGVATWAQRRRPPWAIGAGFAAGVAALLAANQALERLAFGSGLRASRTSDAAGMAVAGVGTRAKDALITSVGLNRFSSPTDWILGAVIVAALAGAAWVCTRPDAHHRRVGVALFLLAAYGYVIWALQGQGFLPGMLTASPLAVVGLVAAWRAGPSRLLGLISVGALPLVWLVQYSGGTAPIWGARYLLLSSTLLAVVGVVALGRMPRAAAVAFVVLAALVTASGLAWMSTRTHAFADAFAEVTATDDPLVMAQAPQMLREAGGFYTPGDRWLTVREGTTVAQAVAVVERSGADRFTLLTLDRDAAPGRVGNFDRGSTRSVPLTSGLTLVATTYTRAAR